MPRGPQAQKRPADLIFLTDVIEAAIVVAKLASCDLSEDLKPKSGRTRSGTAGASARARNLTKKSVRKSRKKSGPGSGK
jgi:hypothetical protein